MITCQIIILILLVLALLILWMVLDYQFVRMKKLLETHTPEIKIYKGKS